MAKHTQSVPRRTRLGRGLSSLISPSGTPPSAESAPSGPTHAYLPADHPTVLHEAARMVRIDEITPNPYQPRQQFAEAALAELAGSIAEQGLLQPLLVVRATDPAAEHPYVLVAGERRLRAARQAGLEAVPCLVRPATDRQMLEWSLIENIHREDLNPIERAHAYRQYMDRFNLTQAAMAQRTGEARATIANHLRLLDLCDAVQQMLLAGELTFGHARALASLAADHAAQRALATRVARGGLSVRQLERLVAATQARSNEPGDQPAHRRPKAPFLTDLETQLTRAVGTRVSILPGRRRNTGRVVVEYYSLDDFDRIARALGAELEG